MESQWYCEGVVSATGVESSGGDATVIVQVPSHQHVSIHPPRCAPTVEQWRAYSTGILSA